MERKRWQRVEALYHKVLGLEPAERDTLLAEACQEDEQLRDEVESLLAQDADARSLLDHPAWEGAESLLKGLPRAIRSESRQTASSPGLPKEDLTGQTISHYKIAAKLGQGGMGVVYKAEDTNLERTVALKFLGAHLLENEEHKERFFREAKAIASLDHPNICVVHEVGEAGGHIFLAMGYIDGPEVSTKIKQGTLKLDDALDIVIQAAEGLRAAHEKDIVHRDVKSSNMMLTTSGQVKIMDFGLAQLPDRSRITATDMIIGTPAYMSPEQAQRQPTDCRTDIWSLGVVLYEMVTGRLPFEGERELAVVYSIVNEAHDLITSIRTRVPLELDRIVGKALAKKPEQRYQRLDDMLLDLRVLREQPGASGQVTAPILTSRRKVLWVGSGVVASSLALAVGLNPGRLRDRIFGGSTTASITSIAVLPLLNLSGDPEQEYFSDGLTEALIANLAKIGALKVISRSSVMRYKETEKPLSQIAAELGVDTVIEGSAQRAGDNVRITAQLIDAEADRHLWAQSYDRNVADVLRVQSEVAQAIAQQIKVTLTPEEEILIARARPVDPEVYKAYLRGMFYLNQETPEGIKKGLAHLREAVEKDPADPLAYAGLALAYSLLGPTAPEDAFTLAKGAATRALQLDATLAEAHAALGQIRLYHDWDWQGAAEAFQRALALNPNLAPAHAHYAWYLNLFGHQDQALAEMERAHQLDPLTPVWATWIGDLHWSVGDHDKAIEALQKPLELHPDFPWALKQLGLAYDEKGMYDEAIAVHQKAVAGSPRMDWPLAYTYALAGRRDEARKIAAEVEKAGDPNNAFNLAAIHSALGETDEAFRWLEAAYSYRNGFTPWLKLPYFKPLRGDPRFSDLLRRLNLPSP